MSKIKIICTIGSKSLNPRTLYRLEELGVDLFRINLSHTPLEQVEHVIGFIQRHSRTPVCLDTEGAQIRTGRLDSQERMLKLNEEVAVLAAGAEEVPGALPLQPGFVLSRLMEGDLLSIDFNSVLVQIIAHGKDGVRAKVLLAGVVGSNKAVTLHRSLTLPPLTPKDKAAIKIGNACGIRHYALSFANTAGDVAALRRLAAKGAAIIAKIESRQGHHNLRDILGAADAILIDRGDLSREIPISLIPFYQRHIIAEANRAGKEVHVATNLLESMRDSPSPTRAEVSDVVNTLMMGANGLVLAAETAIGNRPIESALMIRRLIDQCQLAQTRDVINGEDNVVSSLVRPHGGTLIHSVDPEADPKRLRGLYALHVPDTAAMDAEQICLGTYSPLDGFMDEDNLHAVLDHHQLSSGVTWTMPVLLQKPAAEVRAVRRGQTIALTRGRNNEIFAVMKVSQKFQVSLDEMCRKWFGTAHAAHPGVEQVKKLGETCLAGCLTLLQKRKTRFSLYEFSPSEYRRIFEGRGWSKVMGFHTRNVPHRGHELVQKTALDVMHCDGLLISPVTGQKKKGDFVTDVIFQCYNRLIEKGYLPEEKVLLGGFPTYSRYAGPREAVFTALCRKNYGCSHFIMGRDHTGVGEFYGPKAVREYVESLGDIGIGPVFFDEVYYCETCRAHVLVCGHPPHAHKKISGTEMRRLITGKAPIPPWIMRPEASDVIVQLQGAGEGVFV